MKKDGIESFIFYAAYAEKFTELTDEQFGKLVRHMCEYRKTGEAPEIKDGLVRLAFNVVKYDIDHNSEKYEETCEKRRQAIQERWGKKEAAQTTQTAQAEEKTQPIQKNTNDTKEYKSIQNIQKNTNDTYNENENVNVNENDNENDNENERELYNNINSPTARAYGRFSNIILEKHQYDDLKKEFPEADEAIERMSAYLANEKKTYKNYYARLRLWILQDRKDGKSTEPKKKPNPEPYEYKLGAYKV